jgi:GrpB-like predicted nucleotidyltransferase (UPF0157 family)/2-polyprenyl-3-methyl-5-hydroxy-6-metoxy-1,4-benzoquinol methylase
VGSMLEIVPYDPDWSRQFEAERDRIAVALRDVALRIDHHGSTAVPGLAAKPIIDIQISVHSLQPIAAYAEGLASLGYVHVPHPDDAFCPFFHRPSDWPHTHHVHVVQAGGDEERRTLAFRDYLRAHPSAACAYAALKRGLAPQYSAAEPSARQAYADAKGGFVETIIARAFAEGHPRELGPVRVGATTFEHLLTSRGADTYADFFLPHLGPDMQVLDVGCGPASITTGLARAVPRGRILGVDIDSSGFADARRYAQSAGLRNLEFAVADGVRLPFRDAAFDATFCHSALETMSVPEAVVGELRRITRPGGVVGAASIEYGGLVMGGASTAGPRRFYEIRMQLWRGAHIADPFTGRRLRGLFEHAGFARVEAFADYICYGTPERVRVFARERAAECREKEFGAAVVRHAIASTDELAALAVSWEQWGEAADAFLAFAWCRVLGWP